MYDMNPRQFTIETPTGTIQCRDLADLMKTYSALMLAAKTPAKDARKEARREEKRQAGVR